MATRLNIPEGSQASAIETLISDYTVVEDATPTVVGDTSGGAGQISLDFRETPDTWDGTLDLFNREVILIDDMRGETSGIVTDLQARSGVASFSALSRLSKLVVESNIPPVAGTMGEVVEHILSHVGIEDGFSVDASLSASHPQVAMPAYDGDVWQLIKSLCSAYQIECSLASSNIVFRPLRQRQIQIDNVTEREWTVTMTDLAQNVEVYNYNNVEVNGGLMYPQPHEQQEATVMSVDAGETKVYAVRTSASFFAVPGAVQQPMVIDMVPQDYNGVASVYSVVDKDGEIVSAGDWASNSGFITVEVTEDHSTLNITVGGCGLEERAPFTIGYQIAGHERYSTLRLVGSGVKSAKQLLRFPTGVPISDSAEEVGITVDNLWIGTIDRAYDAGGRLAASYAKPRYVYSITSKSLLLGDGDESYPTFADFDAYWNGVNPSATFATFDAAWNASNPSATFDSFDQWADTLFADDFTAQEFGNIAGSRFTARDQKFRVRNASLRPSSISVSAETDTIMWDHDKLWDAINPAATFASFDAVWAGRTFDQHALAPLHQ